MCQLFPRTNVRSLYTPYVPTLTYGSTNVSLDSPKAMSSKLASLLVFLEFPEGHSPLAKPTRFRRRCPWLAPTPLSSDSTVLTLRYSCVTWYRSRF